ncbi:hypothetical protein Patl1_30965 [Pistacia atlantica]|uniref:Uncharacterized protein n=1 Tax=Pistacia atlantica TaxID=434234 RepID=A0ACC1ACG0_9ROSI|nr:hypothetical protein Patl1_30965 [Pistacia atlantica]
MFYNLLVMIRFLIFSLGILTNHVLSKTDPNDASALNVMFTSLNSPSKLSGWKASGGDPCGQSWKGITCSGSSVTEIKLSGLGLSGQMGYQLSNLKSVTTLDMSSNNLKDSIPYQLPPSLKRLDLSKNDFSGSLPYSISQLSELKYLNLGHNQLNGQVTDMFQKLNKLESMDLSMNKLTGDLPHSFSSLSSLKKLFLQNNQLTGSINVLVRLPLEELNVQNNKFTGWVPDALKDIAKTGGNSWSSGPAPPPPPGAKPVAKKRPADSSSDSSSLSSTERGLVIGAAVLGGLAIVAVLVALVTRKKSSPSSHFLDEERASQRRAFTPLASQELSHDLRSDSSDYKADFSEKKIFNPPPPPIDILKPFERTKSVGHKDPLADRDFIPQKDPLTARAKSLHDNEFANRLKAKRSTSARAAAYSLSDLQTATANFANGRLLGEGTIGRVYRAKYPDGKVLAVKKIDSSLFQGDNTENFSELVANIARNSNGSLHEFLHMSDDFSKPLTWNTRIRIALGTARAVEYLHEACSPSFLHKNIKSSNILLDLELNPHLSDNGLANFHERTSQNLGAGYNAPECTRPSAYTLKSDVYSFGVVMLELLTGRKPYDSKKPKSEQSLVRWAAPQLHEIDALARMVDPALRGLYPPKSLTRFADVIALCVQSEPEFRPPMSEVVEALVRLVQRSSMNMKDDLAASRRTEDSDY